jgi:hypothetical protein
MEVASIVLSSIALAGSILTPIITACALFIGRITHSECCFGKVDLEEKEEKEEDNIKK